MEAGFKEKAVGELFKRVIEEKGLQVKTTANAITTAAELLKLFTREAFDRAAAQAQAEGASTIEESHLAKILPQLLLDF